MKKFFSVMLLAFCLSFAINFFHESKANAERVWAFSLGNVNFYVEIDYSYWFAAVVSNDGRGGYGYPTEFHFVDNMSGRLACEILYGNGTRDFVMLYESSMAQAVFNVLRNHPKFKNDIENALYNLQHREEIEEKKRQRAQAIVNEFNSIIAEGDKFYIAKDYENAKIYYKKARDKNEKKVEDLCSNLLKNGDRLYNEKNFSAAVDYYRKAIVMGSKEWVEYSVVSTGPNTKTSYGEYKAAKYFYNSLVESGNVARKNKKFDDAIKFLNEAINFYPKSSWAYNILGMVYYDMEQYEDAVENYDKSLKNDSNYFGAYHNRGEAYYKLKKYSQAIKDFDMAIQLDSNYAYSYYYRGLCYQAIGDNKKSKKDFSKAKKLGYKF